MYSNMVQRLEPNKNLPFEFELIVNGCILTVVMELLIILY